MGFINLFREREVMEIVYYFEKLFLERSKKFIERMLGRRREREIRILLLEVVGIGNSLRFYYG